MSHNHILHMWSALATVLLITVPLSRGLRVRRIASDNHTDPTSDPAVMMTTAPHMSWSPTSNTITPPSVSTASSASLQPRYGLGSKAFNAARRNMIRGSESSVIISRLPYLKKETCKSEPLEQVISERGCIRRKILNRYCYGQCNSFFVPKTANGGDVAGGDGGNRRRSGRGRASATASGLTEQNAFRSCSVCQPKSTEWITVVLQCPKRTPAYRRKRVAIVKQCVCTALNLN